MPRWILHHVFLFCHHSSTPLYGGADHITGPYPSLNTCPSQAPKARAKLLHFRGTGPATTITILPRSCAPTLPLVQGRLTHKGGKTRGHTSRSTAPAVGSSGTCHSSRRDLPIQKPIKNISSRYLPIPTLPAPPLYCHSIVSLLTGLQPIANHAGPPHPPPTPKRCQSSVPTPPSMYRIAGIYSHSMVAGGLEEQS